MSDNRTKSDEEILALSIQSPDFFAILVDRYEAAFLRKARTILGHREEVYDVVQEAFTKIYLNAKRFSPQDGAKFSSWAYKILINTTITHYNKLKKRGERTAMLDDEIWQLVPDVSKSEIEKKGLRDEVASILSRMPETLAKILSMHFIDDMPQKDIAEKEGISVAAVKTRVHRAKKEFKKLKSNLSTL